MIPCRMNPMGVTDQYLKRLDYLSSAGYKRIYTGLTANTHKLAYEVEIDPNNYTEGSRDIIGNWSGTTRDIYIIIYNETDYDYAPFQVHTGQIGGTAGIVFVRPPKDGNFHTISIQADDTIPLTTSILDGVTAGSGTFQGSVITDMEMRIGIYTWKIRRFKIRQDDILKRDFIPVQDLKGVQCMYDLVQHKFYYMR